jgi:RNA polymerase sigma-70 factor (ECF subfamily)
MPENTTDYDLVRDFLSGNEVSFNKIVNKYKYKIYWHARRMTGNHFDADEVVQEVLIVMYRKMKDFQFKSSLYTWIYRIVATRSLNYLRKRSLKRVISYHDPETSTASKSDDLVQDVELKEKLKKIDELLLKLPAKQREVFILRNYDELSYEEISELTGKSVGGLKANYFHAVKKIMEQMKNYENG